MNNERKYIIGFDILKFLMAIVIISLHAGISKVFSIPVSTFISNFQGLAVPVFFLLSSFLFFEKLSCSQPSTSKNLWQFEKRILYLYLLWSIIMIPITIYLHHYERMGLLGILIWIKDFFFDYTFFASWFFGALLIGMPIVFVLRHKPMVLLLISGFLYVVFSFYGMMPEIITKPFELYHLYLGVPQRSFLCGIIWLGLGFLLSHYKLLERIKEWYYKKRDNRLFFCLFILLVGLTLSVIIDYLQLFGVLSVVILFYLIRGERYNIEVCKLLRQCSIIMYCVHYVFIHIVWQFTSNCFLTFAISCVSSFIVAWIIVRLSNTKSLHILKKLY